MTIFCVQVTHVTALYFGKNLIGIIEHIIDTKATLYIFMDHINPTIWCRISEGVQLVELSQQLVEIEFHIFIYNYEIINASYEILHSLHIKYM